MCADAVPFAGRSLTNRTDPLRNKAEKALRQRLSGAKYLTVQAHHLVAALRAIMWNGAAALQAAARPQGDLLAATLTAGGAS